MRRILAVLVLVLAGLAAGAETVKGLAKPTGYVSDYAGVLSADEKSTIERQCTVLHQKTGTQVAVVTVHRLEGATAQEFAHGISDAWGVGSKGTDKGVVLLIATDDRKRWIDVGYGLEGALNDAKVGDIGRAMVPALKVGKYGEGIELGVGQISDAILADADTAVSAPIPARPAAASSLDQTGLVALFLFGGLGGLVILLILLARRRRSTGAGSYGTGISPSRGSGFFLSGGDSGGSGFSSGSGSSSDTSSSSGSDFGGFDGGSSGGGGAGGDF